jgi:hypothetical protein
MKTLFIYVLETAIAAALLGKETGTLLHYCINGDCLLGFTHAKTTST